MQSSNWYILSALCFFIGAFFPLVAIWDHYNWVLPYAVAWAAGMVCDAVGDYVKD